MCAEHSKDPKPDDNEVCGCPLNPETFYEMDLNTIATCRTAKKLCRKHLLWEKMYRAEIDLKVSFFAVGPVRGVLDRPHFCNVYFSVFGR